VSARRFGRAARAPFGAPRAANAARQPRAARLGGAPLGGGFTAARARNARNTSAKSSGWRTFFSVH